MHCEKTPVASPCEWKYARAKRLNWLITQVRSRKLKKTAEKSRQDKRHKFSQGITGGTTVTYWAGETPQCGLWRGSWQGWQGGPMGGGDSPQWMWHGTESSCNSPPDSAGIKHKKLNMQTTCKGYNIKYYSTLDTKWLPTSRISTNVRVTST